MTTYAALTDGTTNITFASPGTLGWYRIETGWTPKVAGLRQNMIGGRGPYEDVTEEIPVSIGGSNAAHLYANMRGLQDLLWKSNRWYRDENVAAVLFKYSPEGATVSTAASPLQSAVWGATLDMSPGVTGIPQSGSAVWTRGATLRFNRGGAWLHTDTTASAAGSNGSPVLVTMASTAYDSPTKVSFTNFNSIPQAYTVVDSYALVSDNASGITIINAEAGSGIEWTTASAAYYPLGASVNTFSNTLYLTSAPLAGSISTLSGSTKNYAVFANVIVLSAASYANLSFQLQTDKTRSYATTPVKSMRDFAASNAGGYRPRWVSMGVISTNFTPGYWYFNVDASAFSGSPACSFSVDTIILADLEHTSVVEFNSNPALVTQSYYQVTEDNRALTRSSPFLSASTGEQIRYFGDPYISTQGGSLYCLLLSNNADTNDYAFRSVSGASVLVNNWSVTRTTAYLTPE